VTSANDIKSLREKTGAGFLECKKALESTENDMEKAITYLREKGLAAAVKKAGRTANEGRIHSYIHGNGKLGVLVEVNCETDFVAKTEEFVALANNIALHIAATNPRYLNKEAVPQEDIEKERAVFRAQAENSGKKGPVIDKIVDGKVNKFYEEVCLMHQAFVKEPEKNIETVIKESIAKLGENIAIRRFVRFQLGEGQTT
jgi:elongation factor Ts